jgi:hypothetical protein
MKIYKKERVSKYLSKKYDSDLKKIDKIIY